MRSLGMPLIMKEGLPDICDDDRFRHAYIFGSSGTGKSIYLINLIRQELDHCCIVIDPAGFFAEAVAALSPPDRLIYISKTHPLIINPLNRPGLIWSEVATEFTEALNSIISSVSSSPDTTTLMNELIRNAIRVLSDDKKNIEHMADILMSEKTRDLYRSDKYWEIFDRPEKVTRQYEFREKRDSAKRVASRLSAFYDNEVMRAFTIGKNEFDVARFVGERNIVVLNLKGFDNDSKVFLGNLAISAVKSYYNHLETTAVPPLYLYVDEFFRLKVNFWEEMLSQARKYNISINLAHQDMEQVSKSVLSSILGNVYCKVVFSCGATESRVLGEEFDFKPDVLKNLGKHQAYVRIGNKNHKVLTDPPPEIPLFTPPKPKTILNFLSDDPWIDQDKL